MKGSIFLPRAPNPQTSFYCTSSVGTLPSELPVTLKPHLEVAG